MMLKWNAQRGVVVIPKAQTPAHFKANFEGFWDWSLTEEQKVQPQLHDSALQQGTACADACGPS